MVFVDSTLEAEAEDIEIEMLLEAEREREAAEAPEPAPESEAEPEPAPEPAPVAPPRRKEAVKPVEVAPELAHLKPQIEKAREEQVQRRKEEKILSKHRERQEEAEKIMEQTGVTAQEALASLGAPVPQWAIDRAQEEAIREVEKKAKVTRVGVKTETPGFIQTAKIKALREKNPRLYKILKEQGIEAYNRVVLTGQFVSKIEVKRFERSLEQFKKEHTQLPDGSWIANDDFRKMQVFNKAIIKLNNYTDEEGMVDGAAFLRDNPKDRKTLKDTGLTAKNIADWRVYNAQLKQLQDPEVITLIDKAKGISRAAFDGMFLPYIKSFRESKELGRAEAKGIITPQEATTRVDNKISNLLLHTADILVPGVWARRWNEFSPLERAINISLDLLIVVPIARASLVSVRGMGGKAAVKALIKSEAKLTQALLKPIRKTYGKEFAQKFSGVSKAQQTYLARLAKLERLKAKGLKTKAQAKAVTVAEERLKRSAKEFKDAAKGKMGFEDNLAREMFERIEKDIIGQTKAVSQAINSPKSNIKLLKAELGRLESELARVKTKHPTDPTRWTDLVVKTLNKTTELNQATSKIPLQSSQSRLVGLRSELINIDNAMKVAQTPKLRKQLLFKRNKLSRQAREVEAELQRGIARMDVDWGRGGGLPKSRGRVPTLTRPKPRRVLPKEFKVDIQKFGAGRVTTATMAEGVAAITRIFRHPLSKDAVEKIIHEVVTPDVLRRISEESARKLQRAIQTKVRAISKPITASQLKAKVRAITSEQVKAQGVAKEAAKVSPEVKPLIQPAVKPSVKPITKAAIKPAVKVPVKPIIPKPKLIPKIIPPSPMSDNERRRIIKKSVGAITFRMGELNKRDVWYTYISPYQKPEDKVVVVGKPPLGATIVRGPGSAIKTAQLLYGKTISRKIMDDVGFMDVIMEPISGRRGMRLTFKPDPLGETTGDFGITKRSVIEPDKKGVFPLKNKVAV